MYITNLVKTSPYLLLQTTVWIGLHFRVTMESNHPKGLGKKSSLRSTFKSQWQSAAFILLGLSVILDQFYILIKCWSWIQKSPLQYVSKAGQDEQGRPTAGRTTWILLWVRKALQKGRAVMQRWQKDVGSVIPKVLGHTRVQHPPVTPKAIQRNW